MAAYVIVNTTNSGPNYTTSRDATFDLRVCRHRLSLVAALLASCVPLRPRKLPQADLWVGARVEDRTGHARTLGDNTWRWARR